jgi:hypothetical protein
MSQKLKWSFGDRYDDGKDQQSTCRCGHYAVARLEGGQYAAAYVDLAGEATAVVEAGTFGQAYNGSVRHHAANHQPYLEAVEAWVAALPVEPVEA